MKTTSLVLASILLLSVAALAQMPPVSFNGSLTAPCCVDGTAPWDQDFKIEWTITQQNDGSWCYNYLLSGSTGCPLGKDPSHLIIETSPDIGTWGFQMDGIDVSSIAETNQWFHPDDPGNANPLLPGSIYGLKINTPDGFGGVYDYLFYSDRAPTWGDFYVKDGVFGGDHDDVVAWNRDFLMDDPTVAPQDGLLLNPDGSAICKILRPDTETTVIPEPATMMLLGLGLTAIGVCRRQRRN